MDTGSNQWRKGGLNWETFLEMVKEHFKCFVTVFFFYLLTGCKF